MISNLGQGLILASLLCATGGSVAGLVGGRNRSRQALQWARNGAYGFSASMILANLLMVYALIARDFSVAYVAEVGGGNTPLYFTIVSLWASLNGSILFWGGILGVYTAGFVYNLGDRHREYQPWAIHVLLGIGVFFAMLVASIADPFAAVPPELVAQLERSGGPGPNPLLQNHWLMAIHPPMLYLGYVGMSVPFATICAALLAGRLEAGWMGPVRRWMLIPYSFLSVGIVLGGWWSYAVLGWGGSWAWDPVENASFHPWLTATAFLHSAMVLQRRGNLRDWTLVLGMSTFLLTLLGTFMTRSGVFNSVHSFTQSDIGPVFLGFIAFTLLYSVGLLAFRSHLLDEESQATDKALGRKSRRSAGLVSREGAMVIQNALFAVFTFTVLFGTLFPLIVEALQAKRVSVGEPFFDKWALPLGLGIVFMMGVGPALPWGRLPKEGAKKRLGIPAAVGLGTVAIAMIFGIGTDKPFTLLALFTIGFAFWGNFYELLEPTLARMKSKKEGFATAMITVSRKMRRRLGGHLAHYGVLLIVFSLALTKAYRFERDFTINKGDVVEFQNFNITYREARMEKQQHRDSLVVDFGITENGKPLSCLTGGQFLGFQKPYVECDGNPRMNYYPRQREPIYTPGVTSSFMGDLYISLIDVPSDGKRIGFRAIYQPFQLWMWLGMPLIFFGTWLSIWPEGRRRKSA